MAEKNYEAARPAIPAELRRAVAIESGHECAIKSCHEHTYLEIHHIDENRENNTLPNLILLCDKHHKMAHANVIDRKSLKEYKNLLNDSYNKTINQRFDQLEELIKGTKTSQPIPVLVENQPADQETKKYSSERHDILQFALTHVAICHYEKMHKQFFEHQVQFSRNNERLLLDALRQDDDLDADIIIDVYYFRKSYQDAPAYGLWLDKKIELYELLTGRQAKGVLLAVVGKESMKGDRGLPLTASGIKECKHEIQLEIFSCEEVGFHPGAVSAAAYARNVKIVER